MLIHTSRRAAGERGGKEPCVPRRAQKDTGPRVLLELKALEQAMKGGLAGVVEGVGRTE